MGGDQEVPSIICNGSLLPLDIIIRWQRSLAVEDRSRAARTDCRRRPPKGHHGISPSWRGNNSAGICVVSLPRETGVPRQPWKLLAGWSIRLGRSIMAALQRIGRKTSPFIAALWPDAKDAKWPEPKIVCEVEFSQWTRDGRERQPAFKDSGRTRRRGRSGARSRSRGRDQISEWRVFKRIAARSNPMETA